MYGALIVRCFKCVVLEIAIRQAFPSGLHFLIVPGPYSYAQAVCAANCIPFSYRSGVWLRLSAAVWWKCKASNMFNIHRTRKLIVFELVSIADMCTDDNCGWVFILSGILIIWRLELSYLRYVHFEWHPGVCGIDAFWRILNAQMRQKMCFAVQWDSDSAAAVTCKLWRR